ncbi:MAG: hypothetical protein PHE55_07570 [Methylococcaceae bacterium]|nr:hypothetical protein [Methylococcaceae bacterium]
MKILIFSWAIAYGFALPLQAAVPDALSFHSIDEIPSSLCSSKVDAEQAAKAIMRETVRNYCRSQGYGWRAATIKDHGELNCQLCGEKQVSCGYSKVRLECRKPESRLSWLGWFGLEP